VTSLAPRPKWAAVKFPNVGSSVTGTIALEPEEIPVRNFDTGQPELHPDGSARTQVRLILNTANGTFALYCKGAIGWSLTDAMRSLDIEGIDLEQGGTVTVTRVEDGEPKRAGLKPPHRYEAKYVPPSGQDDGPPF